MTDICSSADVEALTQRSFDNASKPSSGQVQAWITQISARLEEITGYVFAETSQTDVLDGDGDSYIMLSKFPIISVTSLVVDGSTLTLGTNFWIRDYKAGILESLVAPVERLEGSSSGRSNVTCVYKYGISTIPSRLKELCAVMVSLKVMDAIAVATIDGAALKSYSDGDISISYNDADRTTALLLESYRNLMSQIPKKVRMEVAAP